MKKLFYLILLIPFFSFGQYNNAYLNSEADSIKNETIARKNNATRLVRLWKNQNKSFVNGTMITTTGTSGPASFNSSTGVLNIPNYSLGGGGLTTASQGLTAIGSDVQFGGIVTGGTLKKVSSASDNGFAIEMYDATSHGGYFQVSSAFSFWTQNSNGDANTFAARINPSTFNFEYPVNTIIGQWDGSTKSLTIGNGGGVGYVRSPRFLLTNPTTISGTQNDLLVWNISNGEITHNVSVGVDATNNFFYINKSLKELPVVLGTISSTRNDYAIGDGIIFEINSGDLGTTRSITGIAGGVNGRVIYLHSTNDSDVIAINHQDSGSSASNRIKCASGATMNLNPNRWLMLSYSTTDNRWHDVTF